MTKREPFRDEIVECGACGKRIGRFHKAFTIPDVEGIVCRGCYEDWLLVDFDEDAAIARVRERRRTGWSPDKILPDLRKWMHPPTHDRFWEHAGTWNAMDVHDYMTRHWGWAA